jgi:hypothetical protein
MKYGLFAAAVILATFATILGGKAADAQRPPIEIVLTCDAGVTASGIVTLQPSGGSDFVTCGTRDAGFGRASSVEFDIAVGGATTAHCIGSHRVPARVVCDSPDRIGATLTVK